VLVQLVDLLGSDGHRWGCILALQLLRQGDYLLQTLLIVSVPLID
jgi:hypothetical protein